MLGQKIVVHTDHKNIIYGNLTNDRIARWQLLLEEFAPEYRHIAGKDNVVADAMSRMDMDEGTPGDMAALSAHCMCTMLIDESVEMPDADDAVAMATCFALDEDHEFEQFPMGPRIIAEESCKRASRTVVPSMATGRLKINI